MIINHNMSAINANRQLGVSQTQTATNMEKLSSGLRINKAADDASGLAVSEKMRSQIRGLNQAEKNIQNGVSFIQTTEGYLQETQDILHRVRELSVQASNGIYTAEDRMQIQVEVSQLVDEMNRIASHAQFNGMNLLTGRFAESSVTGDVMALQVLSLIHISEPTRPLYISYAVFCLKKKKKQKIQQRQEHNKVQRTIDRHLAKYVTQQRD
eukprot:TRINITY_DN2101_c0_g1_i2.p1 TRINITY_DN2101_c0_g1~~TRINITY_DN2101_c0_g1_i2.p1  ORF type:complete len:222 (+),score=35.82 TRINITY_DN2101_c0_g1_i2:34-666(+)